MQLVIEKETNAGQFPGRQEQRLEHYRAVLTGHEWLDVQGQEIGLAFKRELRFALDRMGNICWMQKVR